MTSSEYIPKEFVDENGDVRPDDDNPEGFEAVGHTQYGADFTREEAVETIFPLSERFTDGDVDLQELLNAAKAFAHASMLSGLIKSRLHSHQPSRNLLNERENHFRLGSVNYRLAMGYSALKEEAMAQGVDEEEFDHRFTLNRNNFYRLNRKKPGEDFRKNLKKAVDTKARAAEESTESTPEA